MTYHVDAIYQNGVFRPLEPVTMSENQRVALRSSPFGSRRRAGLDWKESASFADVFAAEHGILPDSTLDIAADRMR